MQHKGPRAAGETELPGGWRCCWVKPQRSIRVKKAAPDQGKRLSAESRRENVAPCPGVDSTRMTPPWRRAMAWAIANPNPVPPC
jgi:hypothetical protein